MIGGAARALVDTLRVFVHDSTVVRDTVVRVAAPMSWGTLTLKDYIGWAVTLIGVSVAAYVAMRGWQVSMVAAIGAQHTRRQLDDDASRVVIREVLLDALANMPTLFDLIIEALNQGHAIPESVLTLLDVAREGYDQHWDKVYLLEDRRLRRDTVNWFREQRMGRINLERYTRPWSDTSAQGRLLSKATRTSVAHLTELKLRASDLFDRLGFSRPQVSPAGMPDTPAGVPASQPPLG